MTLWLLASCDLTSAPDPADATDRMFDVPSGATARGLADELADAGLVSDGWRWEWWLRTGGGDGTCVKAGRHRVNAAMDAAALLAALCGVPVPDDEPFTVVEGWRVRDIDAALAAKGWIPPGAYIAAAQDPSRYTVPYPLPADTLEGYLFPETYKVEPDHFDPEVFIQRQLDTFAQRFVVGHADGFGDRTLAQIVVMASMVEREEPTPANRPMIAGILWRRLDASWNLGVDATSRYTLTEWNDRRAFLEKLRDPKDPWNTRLRGGLPPTAIGNPGIVALESAAKPESSEFWYYLHDGEQKLHPSRSVAEHEEYRRKYNVY